MCSTSIIGEYQVIFNYCDKFIECLWSHTWEFMKLLCIFILGELKTVVYLWWRTQLGAILSFFT